MLVARAGYVNRWLYGKFIGRKKMKVQEGEAIIHELKPESAILGVWFFTKCLLAAFVGGFLCFWCFGFFGGILGVAMRTDSSFPLAVGAVMALIVAFVVLVLALVFG